MSILSNLIFPAPAPSYNMHSFPDELIWIPWKSMKEGGACLDYGKCRAGDCIPALMLRCNAARYLILYLHSNGEDIGLAYSFGYGLRMVLEVHVLLLEYPGYGISPGECSEETIWNAAVAALRFIVEILKWPIEDVIIMGRSLGAAVAMRLACAYACHGLILIAPFLSLVDAAAQYVGILAPVLVGNAFCNREHIMHVRAPTLVIHGQNDRLIPCVQGQQLWELCPQQKKLFVCPEQMSHNSDLLSNAEFLIRPMLRFFALPDYSFVELDIPAEAFDKRHCPQYHKLIEMAKDDAPLIQPLGDQEPCPAQTTMCGPQSSNQKDACRHLGGDEDMPDGLEEDVSAAHQAHLSARLSWNQGLSGDTKAVTPRSREGTATDFEPPILEVEPRPIEPVRRMVSHRSPVTTYSIGHPEDSVEDETEVERAQRFALQRLALLGTLQARELSSKSDAEFPPGPAECHPSRMMASGAHVSGSTANASFANAAAGARGAAACSAAGGEAPAGIPVRPQPASRSALDHPGGGLPGFHLLDIDSGISKFLHESQES
mmetsp:Transcript_114957/g.215149  ORF Transcript_114957/g.215149 Transcript_114957/m.215149 type:complete len:545 (-) Transcript_114957:71-1705(-)